MKRTEVTAIIRTQNSFKTLPRVIQSLEKQCDVLVEIIIVDNSSEDCLFCGLPYVYKLVKYPSTVYSYAKAINIALPWVDTEYVLIISSHTEIQNTWSLQSAIHRLDQNANVAAICFSGTSIADIAYEAVCSQSFNGWNGAYNTATIYRAELLRERQFREDILSAEDQEWSKWALVNKGFIIEHVVGCGMSNMNPRRLSFKKRLKEWEFISYYCYPRYLDFPYVLSRFTFAVRLCTQSRWIDSFFNVCVCIVLLRVRFLGVYSRSSSY